MPNPRSVCFLVAVVGGVASCGADEEARAPTVDATIVVPNDAPHAMSLDNVAAAPIEEKEEEPPSLSALLDWQRPIIGRITSPFGPRGLDRAFHDAVDIAAPMGAVVVAPADLRIRTIAYQARAGRYVIADVIGEGGVSQWRLTFAHLSHVAVFEGDQIKRGQKLGLIGLSGSATGAHLHFRVEAVEHGERVALDPLDAISSLGT